MIIDFFFFPFLNALLAQHSNRRSKIIIIRIYIWLCDYILLYADAAADADAAQPARHARGRVKKKRKEKMIILIQGFRVLYAASFSYTDWAVVVDVHNNWWQIAPRVDRLTGGGLSIEDWGRVWNMKNYHQAIVKGAVAYCCCCCCYYCNSNSKGHTYTSTV